MENMEKNKQMNNRLSEWRKTTAKFIQWTREIVRKEKKPAEMHRVDRVYTANNKRRPDEIPRDRVKCRGSLENAILYYITRGMQLLDEIVDLDGIQNSTQVNQKGCAATRL